MKEALLAFVFDALIHLVLAYCYITKRLRKS
jgi:hypothetical protein